MNDCFSWLLFICVVAQPQGPSRHSGSVVLGTAPKPSTKGLPQPWWLLRNDLLGDSGEQECPLCPSLRCEKSTRPVCHSRWHFSCGTRPAHGNVKNHISIFGIFLLADCSYPLIVHCGFSALQRTPQITDPAAGCLLPAGQRAWKGVWVCTGV